MERSTTPGAEAGEALKLAASLARAAGASLRVEGALDDRPPSGRYAPVDAVRQEVWDELVQSRAESLREDAEGAAAATGAKAEVSVTLGAPADLLRALSEAVDLLVIGARRSGPAERVHLGSRAKPLLHDGRCPIVVVPV